MCASSLSRLSIALLWFFAGQDVMSCEPINGRFQPHGEVVSVSNEAMRGPSGSLAYMLDALFARRQSDPVTVAIRIEINPVSYEMRVTNELSMSVSGRSVIHKVKCEGMGWVYAYSGAGSAEGVYRARDVRVEIKQIESGVLEVHREKHLISGLIFKNEEFYSSVSRFIVLDDKPASVNQ